jgi:chemotaxis response regulator CheB
MAYVVGQSLDAGHESLLSGLLGKKTMMPVKQIHDGMTIGANHVYVIPPNVYADVERRALAAQPPRERRATSSGRHPVCRARRRARRRGDRGCAFGRRR